MGALLCCVRKRKKGVPMKEVSAKNISQKRPPKTGNQEKVAGSEKKAKSAKSVKSTKNSAKQSKKSAKQKSASVKKDKTEKKETKETKDNKEKKDSNRSLNKASKMLKTVHSEDCPKVEQTCDEDSNQLSTFQKEPHSKEKEDDLEVFENAQANSMIKAINITQIFDPKNQTNISTVQNDVCDQNTVEFIDGNMETQIFGELEDDTNEERAIPRPNPFIFAPEDTTPNEHEKSAEDTCIPPSCTRARDSPSKRKLPKKLPIFSPNTSRKHHDKDDDKDTDRPSLLTEKGKDNFLAKLGSAVSNLNQNPSRRKLPDGRGTPRSSAPRDKERRKKSISVKERKRKSTSRTS